MEKLVIQGGSRLAGTVRASGSKNAALPMMAASLLCDGELTLHNIPNLVDVRVFAALLRELGVEVGAGLHVDRETSGQSPDVNPTVPWEERPAKTLTLRIRDEREVTADYELVRRMRAGVCVLGPLLAKRGRACVSLPGGCQIGQRPIDLHLKGLRALGAQIDVRNGYVEARARRLRGAPVYLGGPYGSTVTGTCNMMSAATLAHGTTVIQAAACEPEVIALGTMLNSMGARIVGLGTPTITIDGVSELHAAAQRVIPDRIETGTLLIAAAITRGEITVTNARPADFIAVMDALRQMGVEVETAGTNGVTVSGSRAHAALDLAALPYPGIPTDLQAQLMALMSLARGSGMIRDHVFPDRFMHVPELNRMGASIRQHGDCALVTGVTHLSGAQVMASDLRASAALVLAGLAAQGETVIRRIYHLDRGYERLEEKLNVLGANIRRIADEQTTTLPERWRQDRRKPA